MILLAKKTIFNDVVVKLLFGLQQQGARATGRVVHFIDGILFVYGQLRYKFGHMLRGKKLAARLARIGGIIGNKKLIRIAKEVNAVAFKITKVNSRHTVEHCGKAGIFILYRSAKAVAGGVKVRKEALYVLL